MSFMKFKVRTTHSVEGSEYDEAAEVSKDHDQLLSHPSLAYLWRPRTKSIPSSATVVPDSEADSDDIAAHLKSLTQTMQELLCDPNQLSHPLLKKHISPTFSAKVDGYEDSRCRDDHLAKWVEEWKHMSKYQAEIVESIAEIHESRKKATVWTFKQLSGLPVTVPRRASRTNYATDSGICKESVAIMRWELRGQDWVCVRLKMVNGVSGFA